MLANPLPRARGAAGSKPFPLSWDFEREALLLESKPYPDLGGPGMFDDVMDRLFGSQIQMVARLRGERHFGKLHRHVPAAAHARFVQVFLREPIEVSKKALQGIVARVDRPDHFVHRARQRARAGRDFAGHAFEGGGLLGVPAQAVPQQRDLRQPGPQLVVDVGGDALAFVVHGLLELEPLQPPPRAGPFRCQRRRRHRGQQRDPGAAGSHRRPLIDPWHHLQLQGAGRRLPGSSGPLASTLNRDRPGGRRLKSRL